MMFLGSEVNMSTTEKLAKFVIESKFDSYPEEASSQIKKSMINLTSPFFSIR